MKYRLGDICTITKGGTGIMKAIPGPYKMIALGETDKTHNEFQFDSKAVIIPLVSSTGHGHASMMRVKYCEGKFALGNILCAVIPKDENFVLAKYLHIYLHWNREELLVSQMKGMANVSLPMNRIADVMVTVPSIEKQREIIKLEKQLVNKEVEAVKLFADQLTQLENLNQAILQEAVQGKLVKQDPSRKLSGEPASELLKRIKAEKAKSGKKEKPLPPIKPEEIPFEIPENWVWCRLGEVVNLSRGRFSIRPRNDRSCYGGDYPFIQIGSLDSKGSVINDFTQTLNEKGLKASKQFPEGTIAIAIVGGTIGNLGVLGREMCFPDSIVGITPSSSYNHEYILNFLRYIQPTIRNAAYQMAGQPNIKIPTIENLTFPLPPLSEQKRIVAEIEKQIAKTKQLKEHIIANQQATEQLLKALLHQAFEVKEMEEV